MRFFHFLTEYRADSELGKLVTFVLATHSSYTTATFIKKRFLQVSVLGPVRPRVNMYISLKCISIVYFGAGHGQVNM